MKHFGIVSTLHRSRDILLICPRGDERRLVARCEDIIDGIPRAGLPVEFEVAADRPHQARHVRILT